MAGNRAYEGPPGVIAAKQAIATGRNSGSQSYSGPLGDGSHTFSVKASDNAGNTDSTPASFTWLVDTVAPMTSDDAPSGWHNTAVTGVDGRLRGDDVGEEAAAVAHHPGRRLVAGSLDA